MEDGTRFCPNCGTPKDLTSSESVTETPETTQAATTTSVSTSVPLTHKLGSSSVHKRRTIIIALVASIVIVALVAALAILRIHSPKGASQAVNIMHTSSSPVGEWSAWKTDDGKEPDYSSAPYYRIKVDKDGKISLFIKAYATDDDITKLNGKYAKEPQYRMHSEEEEKKSNFYNISDIAMSKDYFGKDVAPTIRIITPKSGLIGEWSVSFDFLQSSRYYYADVMDNGTIRTQFRNPDAYEEAGTGTAEWTPVPCDQKNMLRYKLTFGNDTWWVQGPKSDLKVK